MIHLTSLKNKTPKETRNAATVSRILNIAVLSHFDFVNKTERYEYTETLHFGVKCYELRKRRLNCKIIRHRQFKLHNG